MQSQSTENTKRIYLESGGKRIERIFQDLIGIELDCFFSAEKAREIDSYKNIELYTRKTKK